MCWNNSVFEKKAFVVDTLLILSKHKHTAENFKLQANLTSFLCTFNICRLQISDFFCDDDGFDNNTHA